MRIVYAVYNIRRAIVTPSLIDIHDGELDPEEPDLNKIMFKEFHTIKNIQPHPSTNLVLEFQVPKPDTGKFDRYISYGWTLLNLFDSFYELNRGIFKLPIYMSPTKTDLDVRDIPMLRKLLTQYSV